MAYNYLAQFISEGPYLHSDPYHFRMELHNQIEDVDSKYAINEINDSVNRLQQISNQLKDAANEFLVQWNGDYKLASQDIFGLEGSNSSPVESQKTYRKILNKIMNSKKFVNIIDDNTYLQLDPNKLGNVLGEFGIKGLQLSSATDLEKTISTIADSIMGPIVDKNKNSKRTYIYEEFQSKLGVFLEQEKRVFFEKKDSLKKELERALKKQAVTRDWGRIFNELKKLFLSEVPGDKQAADNYIESIRTSFIQQGTKLKAGGYSNIAGFIAENLEVSIINNSTLELTVLDIGELDEPGLLSLVQSTQHILDDDISVMSYRNVSKVQSGTDWLITNGANKTVRAQVKNSPQIMDDLRASTERNIDRPQSIKVQDEISYTTLKRNLSNYSKGSGLTKEDWLFLDYLISNMLWFRAVGGVSKDKGKNFSSGISGIQEIINRLLTKEIGYFLGITLEQANPAEIVNVVLGGSNIFFVIDNRVLYPTYLLIDSIIQQLQATAGAIAKLYVTVQKVPKSIASGMGSEKDEAKRKNSNWSVGQPYGPQVLEVGRFYGNKIISQAKISRVNMNLNINEILHDIYQKAIDQL